MIAEEEKPLKTRDDIIKSIKENQDLDVDPIDESGFFILINFLNYY